MSATVPGGCLPADVVLEFTAELSRALWHGGDGWSAARWLHDQPAAGPRRDELTHLVDGLAGLSPLERGDFAIAVNDDQVRSKLWLIDELSRHCDLGRASLLVLGGWYGILPLLANWRLAEPPARMLCIDVDPAVGEIGARVIGSLYPNVHYRDGDLTRLDYRELEALPNGIVINTSCEHIADRHWWSRVPRGQLAVLQSNDFTCCPEHVSCVRSVDELVRKKPMTSVLFAGELQLAEMHRYMLIGHR
ncbi:hypothetical protein OJ998_01125 [Solirubrobacter taibaiensis]|nr:hypothetical protein [Solirubrobacter taibaiensis]